MKQTVTLFLIVLASNYIWAQSKNFIDLPYIETTAQVDTLIIPDEIYLEIRLTEQDTKGKISVEELENRLAKTLKNIGINIKKQLFLKDLASNFKKYFLKRQDVLKQKVFSLIVYDVKTAGMCIAKLEKNGISNVVLRKAEYSKKESLMLLLRSQAIAKAKRQAVALAQPLNQQVGSAIYISDRNNINMRSAYSSKIRLRGVASMDQQAENEPIDVEFEKIQLQTTVNAKFILLTQHK